MILNSNFCSSLSGIFYPESAQVGSYTPSLDVYGSYFPAWLICLIVGVILTILVSLIGRVFDLAAIHRLGPLVPVSLILIFSITAWFLFFAT
jgi:YtcA-like protein